MRFSPISGHGYNALLDMNNKKPIKLRVIEFFELAIGVGITVNLHGNDFYIGMVSGLPAYKMSIVIALVLTLGLTMYIAYISVSDKIKQYFFKSYYSGNEEYFLNKQKA